MPAAILLSGAHPGGTAAEYVLAPDAAVLVNEHGSAFAFDMRNAFYAISAVGATMLERTLRNGKASAVAAVAAEYDAPESVIESDLTRFLQDLEQRGIILRADATAKAAPQSRGAHGVARLARRALRHIASPSLRAATLLTLARLCFAQFGWVATLAAWKAHVPVTAPAAGTDTATTLSVIDNTVRTMSAKLPFGGNCKERALAAWALARHAGADAALIVGVVQYPLGGHTWCQTRDGAILGDEAHHCAQYLPVFRYE